MTENKIILFSNLKGGVGKTTLCAHLANYLASKGIGVAVVDADLQQSLMNHRKRESAANPEQPIPWQVVGLPTSDKGKVAGIMKNLKTIPGYVLIDCPGTLNDPALQPIVSAADAAIIPISYDDDTIDATGTFIKTFRQYSKAKMFFVPNRINTSEGRKAELEQREATIKILGGLGTVTPRIKQSVVIKRYSTIFPLDSYQYNALNYAFEAIINGLKN